MSDNHKKLVKLSATYSLSCDGWVPVKVADWNFFIDSVNELTEENARLREALTELVQLANHPLTVDALDITQSTEMDRAKRLLAKGGE